MTPKVTNSLVRAADSFLRRGPDQGTVTFEGTPLRTDAMRLQSAQVNLDVLAAVGDLNRTTSDLLLAVLAGLSASEIRTMHRDGWDNTRLSTLVSLRH